MVGHEHEFMEEVFALMTIAKQNVYEEIGGRIALKDNSALRGHGSDEERAIHSGSVVRPGAERCEGSHVEIVQFFARFLV